MSKPRAIIIGLDGFELSLAERLLGEGRLPALKRMQESGASLLLDHGKAKRTGLAWEHVSTGLSPDRAKRWAAIDFDPATYGVVQRPTSLKPFAASLGCRTVVFDAPYFNLSQASSVRGLVSWGAHDPGVPQTSQPPGLAEEIQAKFGGYPATEWIYGFVWPDAAKARRMADEIVGAVHLRSDITAWLLSERLPDWDLAYVVISEYHSANESLWHGVDASHPLAGLPSAEPARAGLEGVYEAADKMLGDLMARFPDANVVAFNLHGMGTNDSDVASMALLPELLYRHRFGRARLKPGPWPTLESGVPLITSQQRWGDEVIAAIGPRALGYRARTRLRRTLGRQAPPASMGEGLSVDWMPASRYAPDWPYMSAFALPAYYDGRVRVNLKGREARGTVPPAAYDAVCDEVEALIRECRNIFTGEPVVREIDRSERVPAELAVSEADLVVVWNGAPLGLIHPRLGQIGPLPYHRTGGHSGRDGAAYFAGPGVKAGRYPTRSAFDVLPTVLELLGEPAANDVSGAAIHALIAS